MEYWILQYNPAVLTEGCPHPPEVPEERDYWRIRYYANAINVGDIAFIRHGNDYRRGRKRGIYNVATVVSVPPHNTEGANQITLMWASDRPCYDAAAYRRLGRYPAILIEYQSLEDLQPPLLVDELRAHGLGGLLVIRMPQSGIYRLDHATGERLLEYIPEHGEGTNKLKEPFGKFIEAELGANILLIACGFLGIWKTKISNEMVDREARYESTY